MTEKKCLNRICKGRLLWKLAALFSAAVLLLAGCGESPEESETPGASENAEGMEIDHETYTPGENGQGEITGEAEDEEIIEVDLSEFEGLQVVDSKYQFVNEYTWDDLYTLLAGVAQTTTGLEYRKPYMLIVRLDAAWDPLLFIGLRNNESASTDLQVYAIDEGYLYRLIGFEDEVYYNPMTQFFYLKNAGKKYIYAPHVFLEGTAAEDEWPKGTVPLPLRDISGIRVSVDNLDEFILDISEGGESE